MLKSVFYGKYVLALFCIVLGGPLLAAQLTPEQQAAKERGIILYNQNKAISAEPYLKTAAEAGDRDAQYYLGEAIRFNKRYMTDEAYKWYVAAAEQGDYYAMFRLGVQKGDLCSAMGNCPEGSKSPGEWMKQLWATAKPLAEQGDGEAMMILYNASGDLEWLEKSAAAGYARGQWFLAAMYEEGKGFFFLPWNRSERIDELFISSAEGGNPQSMWRYAGILYERGDLSRAREWIEKGAATGYVDLVYEYSASLSKPNNPWGFSVDYVKSYALMFMMLDLNGGGGVLEYSRRHLERMARKMTPEQIEQAKILSREWKESHPPLSFFPDKLGY